MLSFIGGYIAGAVVMLWLSVELRCAVRIHDEETEKLMTEK